MPVLRSWPARTLAVSLALWAILVTAYVSLGFVRHALLPPPFNTLTMVVLMMTTLGAIVGLLIDRHQTHADYRLNELRGYIDGRLVGIETRMEVAADVRYARLHALLVAMGRRFDAMDAPTVPIPRQRIVATVAAAKATLLSPGLDPEVLDLARRLNAQMAQQADEE
jgi:hypothetical protein